MEEGIGPPEPDAAMRSNITSRWTDLAIMLGRAVKNTRGLVSWSSIPWFIGWATLTVMGPVVAVKVAYRTLHTVLAWFFSSNSIFRGKVVMITGASSGLGEAIAHTLYRRGARLILASRNTDKLNQLKEALLTTYKVPEVQMPLVVKLDLEDLNSIPKVASDLLTSVGHIDVLVNNAGISYRGAAIDTDVSVDIRLMVVNYFGQVALTKAILPSMVRQRSGHIVAVSSVQGKLAIPYRSCYTASKHALQGFFDSLRAEVADSGVRVSVISPGYIATNLSLNALTQDGSKYGTMDSTTAEGMRPEEVAESVVQCLITGREEVVMAQTSHQLAIILRALTPSVISRVMRRRADRQRNDMAALHKEN